VPERTELGDVRVSNPTLYVTSLSPRRCEKQRCKPLVVGARKVPRRSLIDLALFCAPRDGKNSELALQRRLPSTHQSFSGIMLTVLLLFQSKYLLVLISVISN